MNKTITLSLIAAVIAFGLTLAAFDNSSPPVSAETVQTVQTENNQTVSETFSAVQTDVGDIPISVVKQNLTAETGYLIRSESTNTCDKTPFNILAAQTRKAEIKSSSAEQNDLKTQPNDNNFSNQNYQTNYTIFHGFGVDTLARAKV